MVTYKIRQSVKIFLINPMFIYKYLSDGSWFFINFSLYLFFRATNIYANLESLVLIIIRIFLYMLFPRRKSIQPCRSVSLWCSIWFPALIQWSFIKLSSRWRLVYSTHIRMLINIWTPSPFIIQFRLKCVLVLILFKINFIFLFVPSR